MNPIEQFLLVAAALYFVPTLIAALGRKRNALAVFVLNLLLGWTFFGWVLALVWSCMAEAPQSGVISDQPPREPFRLKSPLERMAENYQRQKAGD